MNLLQVFKILANHRIPFAALGGDIPVFHLLGRQFHRPRYK